MQSVDHLFEEVEPIFRNADSTADYDAIPMFGE